MRKRVLTAALSLGVAVAFVGIVNAPAVAVPVVTSCYGGSPNFSVTTDPGASCVGSGLPQNDINNGVPASFPAGYTLLDKINGDGTDTTDGVAGWLSAISFTGTNSPSGTFTITPGSGYLLNTLILAFKDGTLPDPPGPPTDPGYGAFLLNGALTGSWAILFDHNISHFTLYGQACGEAGCPPGGGGLAAPLPAAVWLLGTVLAGGVGVGRWRKRKAKKAALVAA